MRVDLGALAHCCRACGLAPALPVGRKELLRGRQPSVLGGSLRVEVGSVLLRHLLVGNPGQPQPGQVGKIFAQRQLAVHVQVAHRNKAAVLVVDTLGALVEVLGIVPGPPVVQVAFRVKLAAFVVEAVRELVAHDPALGSIIHRVILRRIKVGRLQNACREVDAVHLRVVIGIHRRRRHLPLGAVHRLTDLCDVACGSELGRALSIAEVVIANNLQARIVPPL